MNTAPCPGWQRLPKRFRRHSADSVEKYRDKITKLIGKARRKQREFTAQAERELRRSAPELIGQPERSHYLDILDGIDARLHAACEIWWFDPGITGCDFADLELLPAIRTKCCIDQELLD